MGAPEEDLDPTSRLCLITAEADAAAPGLCKGAVREQSAHTGYLVVKVTGVAANSAARVRSWRP